MLRQPATISAGLRELIAAYTSYQNDCRFCTHGPRRRGQRAARQTRRWCGRRCAISSTARSTTSTRRCSASSARSPRDLPAVWRDDVAALQAAGWDDEAIYYAITTCALFNFYNRWITATGVPEMSEEAHRQQGKSLATRGYVRD